MPGDENCVNGSKKVKQKKIANGQSKTMPDMVFDAVASTQNQSSTLLEVASSVVNRNSLSPAVPNTTYLVNNIVSACLPDDLLTLPSSMWRSEILTVPAWKLASQRISDIDSDVCHDPQWIPECVSQLFDNLLNDEKIPALRGNISYFNWQDRLTVELRAKTISTTVTKCRFCQCCHYQIITTLPPFSPHRSA